MLWTCISVHKSLSPTMQTIVAAVFSCVASRNKQKNTIKADTAIFRVPSGTAPGFRSNTSGATVDVCNGGFGYSSSANGIFGVYLVFGETSLNPCSANSRGHGLQLRCLSE